MTRPLTRARSRALRRRYAWLAVLAVVAANVAYAVVTDPFFAGCALALAAVFMAENAYHRGYVDGHERGRSVTVRHPASSLPGIRTAIRAAAGRGGRGW